MICTCVAPCIIDAGPDVPSKASIRAMQQRNGNCTTDDHGPLHMLLRLRLLTRRRGANVSLNITCTRIRETSGAIWQGRGSEWERMAMAKVVVGTGL